jgi:predicted amidohydrolase YtcJ
VAIHAIGEMATSQVVGTIGKLKENGIRFSSVRMEHCQFIHKRTACQAKELGMLLSMQPNFSTDSIIYRDRLLPRYLENNNPFRMLIDKAGFVPGEDLIFGSDGMPPGAEAALKDSLFPPLPQQKLTIEEFTAGYCMPDKTHGCIELEMDEAGLKTFSVIR